VYGRALRRQLFDAVNNHANSEAQERAYKIESAHQRLIRAVTDFERQCGSVAASHRFYEQKIRERDPHADEEKRHIEHAKAGYELSRACLLVAHADLSSVLVNCQVWDPLQKLESLEAAPKTIPPERILVRNLGHLRYAKAYRDANAYLNKVGETLSRHQIDTKLLDTVLQQVVQELGWTELLP